ncbi:class I SAM-dependent methyltransferase [Streptomyces sp. NPDC005438]|uniref:class I SAM-dependent methyltransferase n=1 Tax=Streptomyces sp. NPDC005438 TaxID=3156880 RepID=UPI0033A89374
MAVIDGHRENLAYYAREAERLARRYEALTFEEVHAEALPWLPAASAVSSTASSTVSPAAPATVADIGAGTGRDASALAARGFEVTAVEPVAELRELAARLHGPTDVTWVDDALPELGRLSGPFDLVLLSAVWMHLEERQRPHALRRLSQLLHPTGRLVLTLRHGPPPEGRRMFDVTAEETLALADRCGLGLLGRSGGPDRLGRDEVRWTTLVLERGSA